MAYPSKRTWHWTFEKPVGDMWPLLSDTVRFNEAAGMPKHAIEETPLEDGSMLFRGTAKVAGFQVSWREEPVNWVWGKWFRHRRVFDNGPFAALCATLEIEPAPGGCTVAYTLEVEPANLIGRALLATGFFRGADKTFQRLVTDAHNFALGRRETPFTYEAPKIAPETRERVRRMVGEIEQSDYGHGLAERLGDMVLSAQEIDASRIRPLALAHRWAVPERDVTELCLAATLAGLLEVRWDLLCPRCRVAKAVTSSLETLPRGAHCSSCNIDYERDYARNIELSFRPAEAVRTITIGEYCLFGPMSTPHIKAQVTVPAGGSRTVEASLEPGPFRLRSLERGPSADIEFDGGRFPEFRFGDESVETGDGAEAGQIRLTNSTPHERTLIVEDRHWAEDALTADRVVYFQAFRDLFSDQVLRPGDEVSVQRVALMFSDLRGSTALYEEIGEAAAYQLVREHFAFMTRVVREHDGAVVKTIGDAVMASFAGPASAVAAALSIQQKIDEFNAQSGSRALTIKLGVHDGPCIVVTLNGRLDYFGSTVNMAARLQGRSLGGDIVISRRSADDADVKALLQGHEASEEQERLKGFDKPVAFVRLS